MAGASIGDLLRPAGIDPVDARALLCAVLAVSEAQLAAHPEQKPTDQQRERYLAWVERRRAGVPVAYLTGEREFYGLSFKVSPAVLIPRPETELLVELALERVAAEAPVSVLDLGTGSGCIAVAIARHRPGARVTATEFAREALAVARDNAARHSVKIEFVASNWFEALAGKRFELIVANPPYIRAADPHLNEGDLRCEPRHALVSGPSGLECIELIVERAVRHLVAGGRLLFEHGYDQAGPARTLLAAAGYREVFSWRDLAGIERVSGGRV